MKLTPYSHSTRAEVDSDGEIIGNLNVDKGTKFENPGKNNASKYSSHVHRIVNMIIPNLGEKLVAKKLCGKLYRGISHDVELRDGRRVEVKTGRIGSSVTIREGQLEGLSEEDLYALLYYETRNNRQTSPAYYVDRSVRGIVSLSPQEYLLRNIRIKSLFIIARPSIMNFFNTSELGLFHNSSGVPYKSLSRKSAYRIFEENPDNFPKSTEKYEYGRHEIEVFKVGENIL